MMRISKTASDILKDGKLKDTHPRRMVLDALQKQKKPIAPYALQRWLAKKEEELNIATIYRVLDALKRADIVHEDSCDGSVFLCSMPDTKGHHGFLHCTSCHQISEYVDARLCAIENTIARAAKFKATSHLSEVLGLCSSCHS
jgi:Fur family ferric uptake transcriptional regulator